MKTVIVSTGHIDKKSVQLMCWPMQTKFHNKRGMNYSTCDNILVRFSYIVFLLFCQAYTRGWKPLLFSSINLHALDDPWYQTKPTPKYINLRFIPQQQFVLSLTWQEAAHLAHVVTLPVIMSTLIPFQGEPVSCETRCGYSKYAIRSITYYADNQHQWLYYLWIFIINRGATTHHICGT